MKHKSLLAAAIMLILSACEPPINENELDQLKRELDQSLESAKRKIDELTPSKERISSETSEEFAKLNRFEYKVVEFDKSLPAAELESKLGELGNEAWECFHITTGEKILTVFCKRRPKTYLRYVPRMFP